MRLKTLTTAPRRETGNWSLNERRFHFLFSDKGLEIEFRLGLINEHGEIDFSGAEQLAGIAACNPAKIRFGIGVADYGYDLLLYSADSDLYPVCRMGHIPNAVSLFLGEVVWNRLLKERKIEVAKYDVFIAPAWQGVGTTTLGSVADVIDADPEIDVDFLIAEMKQRLSENIYHVQIGCLAPVTWIVEDEGEVINV
jgi:hypothetical protein